MSSKQAALVPVERLARDVSGSAPQRIYVGLDTGVYYLKTLASEATAWLKDDGSGNFSVDDDSAEDDRQVYKIDSSNNLII